MNPTQTPQHQINHLQSLYRQWLALQADNRDFLANLIRQNALADELTAFYQNASPNNPNGQSGWLGLYEAIDKGEAFDLTTQGEASIMSQDTLWDMLCDERAFYEQLYQFAHNRLQTLTDQTTLN